MVKTLDLPSSAEHSTFLFIRYFEGDLTKPLVLSSVAAHTDKIIQARWSVTVKECSSDLYFTLLGIPMKCRSPRPAPIARVLFGLHHCRR